MPKLFLIYKSPEFTNLCVTVEDIEDDIDADELAEYKNDLMDEMGQKFMPSFVVEESEVDDLIKQLTEKR